MSLLARKNLSKASFCSKFRSAFSSFQPNGIKYRGEAQEREGPRRIIAVITQNTNKQKYRQCAPLPHHTNWHSWQSSQRPDENNNWPGLATEFCRTVTTKSRTRGHACRKYLQNPTRTTKALGVKLLHAYSCSEAIF